MEQKIGTPVLDNHNFIYTGGLETGQPLSTIWASLHVGAIDFSLPTQSQPVTANSQSVRLYASFHVPSNGSFYSSFSNAPKKRRALELCAVHSCPK